MEATINLRPSFGWRCSHLTESANATKAACFSSLAGHKAAAVSFFFVVSKFFRDSEDDFIALNGGLHILPSPLPERGNLAPLLHEAFAVALRDALRLSGSFKPLSPAAGEPRIRQMFQEFLSPSSQLRGPAAQLLDCGIQELALMGLAHHSIVVFCEVNPLEKAGQLMSVLQQGHKQDRRRRC